MVWRHNGSFWSPVSSWEPDAGVVLLASHPTEPLVLLTDGDGAMWRSSTGGRSFDRVVWPGEPPQGIAFHPSRRGLCFAWGPDGLWRSLDDGQTWRPLDLEGATVHGLLFDPTVRRLTLALTDQGVFASDDLGRSWYAQSTGLDGPIGSGSVSPRGRVLLTSPDNASVYGMERIANREFIFSSVYFASGAAKPNKALLPHLDEIGGYLMRNRSVVLRVEGHTDSDGSEDSNQKLSEDRAIWVRDYLDKQGIAPHQLQAAGYGETHPLFPNDTLRNKAKNRRVELVLVAPQPDLPAGEGMR